MTIHKQHLLCGLTALSLIAPLASFASPAAFENGFYAGAKIGAQQLLSSWDSSSSAVFEHFPSDDPILLGAINPDADEQSFHTNLMGNLSVGYARVMEKFFLAAELSVNLAEEQESNWTQTANLTVHTFDLDESYSEDLSINSEVSLENPDIILDLRPGFLFAKNFLLYGRVGVAFNELSIEQEGTGTFFDHEDAPVSFAIDSSEEKDVYAWRVGLGMEYKVTPNLALNIDYVFTDYGSIDTEFSSTSQRRTSENENVIATIDATTSADVTKSTATMGFNWYFGGKKPRPAYHGPDK